MTFPLSPDNMELAARIERAREMRGSKVRWKVITETVGLSIETLKSNLVDGYAERRRQQNRDWRRGHYANNEKGSIMHFSEGQRLNPVEAAAALATVPADTRGFTARALGDPLPGRSALDRRRGESPAPRLGA